MMKPRGRKSSFLGRSSLERVRRLQSVAAGAEFSPGTLKRLLDRDLDMARERFTSEAAAVIFSLTPHR